jgi:hypothetical protein
LSPRRGASIAPPPPVPAAAVEEGEAAVGATALQAALETPTETGPSGEDMVVILDEDSAPPPSSEGRDCDGPCVGAGPGGGDGEPSSCRKGVGALPDG